MRSVSSVGSMPFSSAKSSPPMSMAAVRSTAVAISGMRKNAAGVSTMAIKRVWPAARRGLAAGHTRFIAMVETPAAFFRMPEIATAVERTAAMDIGGEDFALENGMEPTEDALLMPKQQMIYAARAAGIMPLGYIASVAS